MASFEDDAESWFKALRNVFKEVDSHMSDDERNKHQIAMKDVEISYYKFSEYINNYRVSMIKSKYITYLPPREVFDKLMDWEKNLRRNEWVKKLLMREGENPAEAIE